jgi:hypothetical protein
MHLQLKTLLSESKPDYDVVNLEDDDIEGLLSTLKLLVE